MALCSCALSRLRAQCWPAEVACRRALHPTLRRLQGMGDAPARASFRLPTSASAAVKVVRQPERHAGPDIHEDHADDDDQYVRHHAGEDLVERDMRGRDALEI